MADTLIRDEAALYRKKPVVVEAMRWTGDNWYDAAIWIGLHRHPALHREGTALVIPTLEGNMRAEPGDWIIRGVKGEFYPCKPDIFEATYEPA